MSKELDYIADLERENRTIKSLLYCTVKSCNNCGKVNCENFQRQRIDCCGHWVSYKDYIKELEEENKKLDRALITSTKNNIERQKIIDSLQAEKEKEEMQFIAKCSDKEEGLRRKIFKLEQQIEKMKCWCNCKNYLSCLEECCRKNNSFEKGICYNCKKWEIKE